MGRVNPAALTPLSHTHAHTYTHTHIHTYTHTHSLHTRYARRDAAIAEQQRIQEQERLEKERKEAEQMNKINAERSDILLLVLTQY